MDNMEEKLGAILSNPQMMESIRAMAQTLGSVNAQGSGDPPPSQKPQQRAGPPAPPPKASAGGLPSLGPRELEMMQKVMRFSQQTSLDRREQELLKALNPYLSNGRLGKLEKAMHAAKLARFAATAIQPSEILSVFGR